jgi:hypothetical protein
VLFENLPRPVGDFGIRTEKYHADREMLVQPQILFPRQRPEERPREGHEDPAAVPGLAIGIHGTPVRHPRQGGTGRGDQFMALHAADVRDQPETATFAGVLRAIQAGAGCLQGHGGSKCRALFFLRW